MNSTDFFDVKKVSKLFKNSSDPPQRWVRCLHLVASAVPVRQMDSLLTCAPTRTPSSTVLDYSVGFWPKITQLILVSHVFTELYSRSPKVLLIEKFVVSSSSEVGTVDVRFLLVSTLVCSLSYLKMLWSVSFHSSGYFNPEALLFQRMKRSAVPEVKSFQESRSGLQFLKDKPLSPTCVCHFKVWCCDTGLTQWFSRSDQVILHLLRQISRFQVRNPAVASSEIANVLERVLRGAKSVIQGSWPQLLLHSSHKDVLCFTEGSTGQEDLHIMMYSKLCPP